MDPVTALIGAIAAIGGAGIMAGSQKSTNATNLTMMREQNQFNAEQAQLTRDWQEEQYLKYSSPSALVQQYKQAGLNPALVGKQGQGAIFSGSTAQAGNAIPAQNPLAGLSGLGPQIVGMIDSLKTSAKQRDLMESERLKNLAIAHGQNIENQFKPEILKQNLQQGELNLENTKIGIKLAETQINLNSDALLTNVVTRDNILSDTYKKYSEIITESTKQGLNIANTILANTTSDKIKAETFEQEWKNAFIEKFKVNPQYAQGIYGLVLQLCAETSNQIIDGVQSISLGNIGTKIKDGLSNMPDPVKTAFYSLYNSSKENQQGIKGPHK